MTRSLRVGTILAPWLLWGCCACPDEGEQASAGTTEPAWTGAVEVREFEAAAGFTTVYQFSDNRIRVLVENDFSLPTKQLLDSALDPTLLALLHRRLLDLPRDRLHATYEEPGVLDGSRLIVTISEPGEEPWTVSTWNKFVPELLPLLDALDLTVPHALRTDFGSWDPEDWSNDWNDDWDG
ncbi:MAG: hypothetical protein AAF196_05175 [Planctomycetota bacterium]